MMLREYFLCAKKKKKDFIWQFLRFCVILCLQTSAAHLGSMSERRLLRQQHHTHALWMCKDWHGREKLFIKVKKKLNCAHKTFSRSIIKWLMNHWCHMVYFIDVLILRFWLLNVSVALLSVQGQKALRFHQKYLIERSYGFGMTWGWVIKDRIFIFGWTIHISYH